MASRRPGKPDVLKALDKRVHDLKNEVVAVKGRLDLIHEDMDKLVTSEDVTRQLDYKISEISGRLTVRSILVVVLAIGLALGITYFGRAGEFRLSHRICVTQNENRQTIRDITDHTLGNAIPTSGLSPEFQKLLDEAHQQNVEFRNFVYSKTGPVMC